MPSRRINMTPAINALKKIKVDFSIHEYDHDPANLNYGTEAAQKLGIDAQQVFKTLVVRLDSGQFVVGIVPVSSKLNMKSIAKAAGAKKASMAEATDVERITGYVLGGVSPLGQRKQLLTFLDSSADKFSTIYISAGRRGLDVQIKPADLLTVTRGKYAELKA